MVGELTPPEKEGVEEVQKKSPHVAPAPYKPSISFPQRFAKAKVEAQLKTFVEILKKIHINVPFTEAMS